MEGKKKRMTVAKRLKEEGFQEGIEEGRQEVVREIARKVLQMNKDDQEIIEITGVTKEELKKLKESL